MPTTMRENERLNMHFDKYTGESMVGKQSMDTALKRLEEFGFVADSNGAKIVALKKYKLE